jgi:hypothetical protein
VDETVIEIQWMMKRAPGKEWLENRDKEASSWAGRRSQGKASRR